MCLLALILYIEHPKNLGGEENADYQYKDSILEYDIPGDVFHEVGHMLQPRVMSSLSVVQYSDYYKWCLWPLEVVSVFHL